MPMSIRLLNYYSIRMIWVISIYFGFNIIISFKRKNEMKIIKFFAELYSPFLITLVIFVTSGQAKNSADFRNIAEIIFNNIQFLKIIEIHNLELKQIETETAPNSDIDVIKTALANSLKKYILHLDCFKESDLSNLNLDNIDLRYFNFKEADVQGSSQKMQNLITLISKKLI